MEFKNSEGYPDPTCYFALTKIAREQRIRTFKPIVYICSPYSGDVRKHIADARRYCRFAAEAGYIPFASHLLYPQFLDDSVKEERDLGLFFGTALLSKCYELWVFGDVITSGMRAEIIRARRKGLNIRYFTSDCKEY